MVQKSFGANSHHRFRLAKLENNTGVSNSLCSTGSGFDCAVGWVIDNLSIGVKITDYTEDHSYEETVTEDFYIPMNKTFGFNNNLPCFPFGGYFRNRDVYSNFRASVEYD